ncbi:MAG TPA: DUF6752 domain-containing protein [Nocardioides sp.]|jgi:hypothetical protein|uniref:DUF6752 domain-containing protein n=1 Tax=Nocardioides sp. TaxID=35761 RepID=UPI002E36FF37|nr:DUF6752 domain-containing protein [Nocardioides sp.]HEX3932370.1 DUF6752 domain-containing protein [Nocardioides sp.]
MTERVFLHVGAPKSGTTYLQRVLDANRAGLADAGVLLVGERHLDRIHAAMAVREDPRLEELPASAGKAWRRLVDQIAGWRGDAAVLSYELFAVASAEQAGRALADLAAYDVHVVVSARDLGRSVVSAWQERLKFGLTTPLEEWRPKPESVQGSEWGWRTLDPSGVAERWGASLPPARVHVVTVPRPDAGPAELWNRFADACGLGSVRVDLAVPRANESVGVVQAELLRRTNGRLRHEISGSRERSVWIRDLLAQEVLAPLGSERIGVPDAQSAEAAEVCARAVSRIEESGYVVHGDLADLRPAPSSDRLPSEVTEAELTDAATACISALVATMRDRAEARPRARTTSAPAGPVVPPGTRARARNLAARALGPYDNARVRQLARRVEELEREVQQARRLHLRVATLDDVVRELLLDPEVQDSGVTWAALRDYRRESL